jgi:hypothetical protein
MRKISGRNYYKNSQGYLVNRNTGEPRHKEVAEKKLGHTLSEGSVVHHINRDKTDNRPSNLWVFKSQKDHFKVHLKDKKRFGEW